MDRHALERLGHHVVSRRVALGYRNRTLVRYGHLFSDDLDAVPAAFDSAADQLPTAVVPKPVAADGNSL